MSHVVIAQLSDVRRLSPLRERHHMHHELSDSQLAEDTPVMVRYPRTPEQERGDRADWP